MNVNENSKDKNWLVKSATRILGPYTLEEVTEMLRTKQVSIIDEVRVSSGRWNYIRENPIFLEIVKKIRAEQESHSDETMTQSVAHHTMTKTDTISVTDDFTRTPVINEWDPASSAVNKSGGGLRDVTPSAPVQESKSVSNQSAKAKSYGSADDSRVQGRIRQKSNVLRWFILGTACAVAAFVTFTWSQKETRKSVGHEELVSQALRYKSLGLYDKALHSYAQASKIREADLNVQAQMAPLLISEDRQSLAGRRILEKALTQEGRGRAEIIDAYLGIAISYMMDGDFKQAQDVLQKAIGYEPHNLGALLNLSIIDHKKGNYDEAQKGFDNVLRKNMGSTLALFGKSLAAIEYAKTTQDVNQLPELVSEIGQSLSKTAYLRQELSLLAVYARSLMKDTDGVQQGVITFLSQPLGQAKNYIHPLNVDWRFTQWDYIEQYCADLYQNSVPYTALKALRTVCLLEVNRDGEAQKLLQEALAEAPNDPHVLITQANYLNKMGRQPEAMVILKKAELETLQIKNLVQGDICLKMQDIPCAKKVFSEIYSSDGKSALALYGLAWVVYQGRDKKSAYDYVRGGLDSEPNFLPLLELRDQLESQ